VLFVREVLGAEPEPYQIEILKAVANPKHRRVAVRSGHGVGKTCALAWAIVWHLATKYPQRTVVTAPTTKQLFDALAAEVKLWMRKLPPPVLACFDIQVEHIYLKRRPEDSYVSFRVSKPETPEALAGVHSDGSVLLVADEASGIPEAVFEAASGSMSGHDATTVLAGNPLRSSGLFYDAFHELSDMWFNIHVNCHDSKRCNADFFEDMRRRYGSEESNEYRVRVLGEFPKADEDTLIPVELVQAALEREVEALHVKEIWGVDCARYGPDRSALARRKGNVLIKPVESWKGLNTMEVANKVKSIWDVTLPSERPEEICIDSIGIGAGVCDRLQELGLPARGINVSENPAMEDRFDSLKAELWWKAKEWFEKRDCNLAGDTQLKKELVVVKYGLSESTGKLKIESKKEVKKRTKKISPDLADAFILTFAGTAISLLHGSANSSSWGKPLTRNIKGLV